MSCGSTITSCIKNILVTTHQASPFSPCIVTLKFDFQRHFTLHWDCRWQNLKNIIIIFQIKSHDRSMVSVTAICCHACYCSINSHSCSYIPIFIVKQTMYMYKYFNRSYFVSQASKIREQRKCLILNTAPHYDIQGVSYSLASLHIKYIWQLVQKTIHSHWVTTLKIALLSNSHYPFPSQVSRSNCNPIFSLITHYRKIGLFRKSKL